MTAKTPPQVGEVHDDRRLSGVLVELARTLVADLSVQRTLDHFVAAAVGLLPIDGAGLLVMDDEEGHHLVAATDEVLHHIERLQVELGQGPCLAAYRSGLPIRVTDLATDTVFPAFSARALEAGLRSVFSLPLRLEGRRLGALELYATTPTELTSDQVEDAQTVADVMAAYLHNARARATASATVTDLQHRALHDPLTGLPNRTLLEDRIAKAVRASQRSGTFVGLLFCDVDGLKFVNDRHGHDIGDRLLAALAQRVQGVLRPGDTLARLAGDEFVVVCEALTHASQAEEVAARITASLGQPLDVGTGRPMAAPEDPDAAPGGMLRAGMSIGIAFAGGGHGDASEALRRADAAMYASKRGGGARMTVAPLEPT
jgi:diguanylate cyclase (GGDEF)-like protein